MARSDGYFKPGNSGRKKGSRNKKDSLRSWLSKFLNEEREQILADWRELSPKARIIMFEKLMNYALPKYSSVNLNLDSMSDDDVARIAEVIKGQDFVNN